MEVKELRDLSSRLLALVCRQPPPLEPGATRITWVCNGVEFARATDSSILSPELCFTTGPTQFRYSFKLDIYPNGTNDASRGCVSVFFVPSPGQQPDPIALPMKHTIVLRVVSCSKTEEHVTREMRVSAFDDAVQKDFNALFLANPRDAGRGFGLTLSAEQLESGDYFPGGDPDTLIFQVELVPPW